MPNPAPDALAHAAADPDLAALVRAWPALGATARQCIMLMVKGAATKGGA